MLRLALGVGALLFAAVTVRTVLILDSAFGFVPLDLRGFAADAGSGLIGLSVALVLGRLSRWLALAWVLGWSLVQYANFETVQELGSIASVLDAHFLADSTFLRGSVAKVSYPGLLALVVCVPLALGAFAFGAPTWRGALGTAAAGALVLASLSVWPRNHQAPPWREVDVFVENATWLVAAALRPPVPRPEFPDPPTAMLDLVPDLRSNLDGEPIVPKDVRRRNVIVIALEGFSGAFVGPIAAANGYGDELLRLPQIGRLASDGIAWSSFVNHQRKTNRGMYSLLCGEPPNLVPATPKMTEHVYGGWRECLPSVLADAGYQTVYQQAAPLPFMLKDQFMPKAGFQRVYGHEVFESAYMRSHWGVDDLAFFEQTVERVQELHDTGKPYFLTLLTVGTHHPHIVPPTWESNKRGVLRRALTYADRAIGIFIDTLRERGLFEDTLVLITSDESRGMLTRSTDVKWVMSDFTYRMTHNWGALIALNSGGPPRVVREPYGQMDVAITILDYLGLADRGRHFFGRSAFRSYAEPRWLFFANSNAVRVSAFDPRNHLLSCNILIESCFKWKLGAGGPFAPAVEEVPWEKEDDLMLELARRSVRPTDVRQRRDFDLVGTEVIPIDKHAFTARKVVHGGQHIDLDANQWLEVEIDVTAHDITGNGGAVKLSHYTKNTRTASLERKGVKSRTHIREIAGLRDGERFRLLYTLAFPRSLQGIKVQSYAQTTKPGEWELHFETARLSVRSGPGRPNDGLNKLRSEIVPAPPKQERSE
jgi:arylsulfatase A-like enzyme